MPISSFSFVHKLLILIISVSVLLFVLFRCLIAKYDIFFLIKCVPERRHALAGTGYTFLKIFLHSKINFLEKI